MDPLLTATLAQRNPSAYRARFKRLAPTEQSALVAKLSPSEFVVHCTALGEKPTVRVDLSTNGDVLSFFRVEFGGLRVDLAQASWADAAANLQAVVGGLPDAVLVTGRVSLPTDAAAAARALAGLESFGWQPTEAFFSTDPSDGRRIRFSFAEAVLVLVGSTGRGDFRGHAPVREGGTASAQATWAAWCASRGLPWRVA